MKNNHYRYLRSNFCTANDGAAAVVFAILLPVIVGFIALATDSGTWFVKQRNMQAATDVSTLSAGREISTLQSAGMLAYVKSESARNGFAEADGVTITANSPPLTGSYAGNVNALEVQLSQPQQRFFSVLATNSDPIASTRAVALRSEAANACVLALDPHEDESIDFSGSPTVGLSGCMVAANSDSENAININGNVTLSAQSLYTVGGYTTTGNSYTLNLDEAAITHAPPVEDPYDNLANPSYGGCNQTNLRASGTVTLSPGVYCGDLTINNSANVTFAPGTYYIHGGQFKVNGNSTLAGNGVTFVLTGSGSNVATVDMNGSASVTLTAPATESTSTPYPGMLFYQDRDAPTNGVNNFSGNLSNNIKGSLYFPNQTVNFSGNSGNASSCLRLVARMIKFSGNSGFAHNCTGVGGENVVTQELIVLVE